jgi:hypothetical protein
LATAGLVVAGGATETFARGGGGGGGGGGGHSSFGGSSGMSASRMSSSGHVGNYNGNGANNFQTNNAGHNASPGGYGKTSGGNNPISHLGNVPRLENKEGNSAGKIGKVEDSGKAGPKPGDTKNGGPNSFKSAKTESMKADSGKFSKHDADFHHHDHDWHDPWFWGHNNWYPFSWSSCCYPFCYPGYYSCYPICGSPCGSYTTYTGLPSVASGVPYAAAPVLETTAAATPGVDKVDTLLASVPTPSGPTFDPATVVTTAAATSAELISNLADSVPALSSPGLGTSLDSVSLAN